jgi:hypothetical protein
MQPKTKTILFILLSFMLGILLGWFLEDRMSTGVFHLQGRGPRDFQKVLAERLHLDEHQIMHVDSILDSRKQRMEEFRKQTLAMRDSIRIEIRRILNPDQAALFNVFEKEMKEKESKRREHEPEKR